MKLKLERVYPLLSVVTPNHNDGDYIERQIKSIMEQDYPNIEQIVVDDASTDHSVKVLKKLEKKYPEKLKVIYFTENKGACIARNEGAKLAKGKYISFLPADAKLYPGMARIWVDKLEENPEYDFVYGGYKFTDANYEHQSDYMGDEFDPYFLQVTNYIDGSFPLKKELFDKMGGWDPKIKSLQDWDLWLNAVVKHGAKGLYIPDVFFETVAPHPGGLSWDSHQNWLARTKQIKDKYGIKQKDICVTGVGARFHARNIAKYLDADYLDMPSFKPHEYKMIYIVGFFGQVREALMRHDGLRVLHWIGSDIWGLQEGLNKHGKPWLEKVVSWIHHNIDINLVEFEPTREELAQLGINAFICPLPPKRFYEPMPLPEKFTVASYLPTVNRDFYYPDLVKTVARKMPDVEFKFFGDFENMGKKENMEHCGYIKGEEFDKLVKDSSCLLRLTKHDGLPLSIVEFSSAGRNIITNVKGLEHVDLIEKLDEETIIDAINKAREKGQNIVGGEYYRKLCDPQKFIETIKNLMVYSPKIYWENRAECWDKIIGDSLDTQEEYIVEHEIKELNPKSILDLGCGNGIWARTLSQFGDYTGVDISENLIGISKKKFPDKEFIVGDIKELSTLTNKQFDVIFSFTTLLHISPEEMEGVIGELKKVGKYLLAIEPTNQVNRNAIVDRQIHPEIIKAQQSGKIIYGIKSSWVHDYFKYFEIIKAIPLGMRTLFIIKL